MKTKVWMVIGNGVGVALYQAICHGLLGIDWYRVAFVTLFTAVVFSVLPGRWFETKKAKA